MKAGNIKQIYGRSQLRLNTISEVVFRYLDSLEMLKLRPSEFIEMGTIPTFFVNDTGSKIFGLEGFSWKS